MVGSDRGGVVGGGNSPEEFEDHLTASCCLPSPCASSAPAASSFRRGLNKRFIRERAATSFITYGSFEDRSETTLRLLPFFSSLLARVCPKFLPWWKRILERNRAFSKRG